MAIFGVGFHYGKKDMKGHFIRKGAAYLGSICKDNPSAHSILESVQIGDIVYLKSHSPKAGLIVSAVGLVVRRYRRCKNPLGTACVTVEWFWHGQPYRFGKIPEAYNVRNNAIYHEMNPDLCRNILQLLIDGARSGVEMREK
jgi:hypothetical protein